MYIYAYDKIDKYQPKIYFQSSHQYFSLNFSETETAQGDLEMDVTLVNDHKLY
jgi:hypothetical protein